MASLLGGVLFETTGQGPSPSKDFFQLVITRTEVIWRWWKISLRVDLRGAAPGELKQSHDEFLHDSQLQHQVGVVFGSRVLEHIQALCHGHLNYLERLPDYLLLHILTFLQFQDIGCLSQTSKRFRKLCNCEEFWEQTVRSHCGMMTENMEMLANAMGWRRTFFTFIHKQERPAPLVCVSLARFGPLTTCASCCLLLARCSPSLSPRKSRLQRSSPAWLFLNYAVGESSSGQQRAKVQDNRDTQQGGAVHTSATSGPEVHRGKGTGTKANQSEKEPGR
ncbi:F-box only protein 36a [Chanos chanos]|uniref:F-box only protein 36a n=1 Tax=Chanos chanos TaxID=29144 RepID=A0A6J2UL80_CHACN|nr:F-box only protein 36 [Chanos chanos]